MADPTASASQVSIPVVADERLVDLEERVAHLESDRAEHAPERQFRHYTVSPLPFLRPGAQSPTRQDVLLAFYAQVCTTWRELVGVRFKLLALVPTVSLVLLVQLVSSTGVGEGLTPVTKTGIAALGLIAVVGLLVYELRNSALHDDLISRGRRIEEELGVDTGQFRGRLVARNRLIKHDRALALVYGVGVLGWIGAIAAIWTTP